MKEQQLKIWVKQGKFKSTEVLSLSFLLSEVHAQKISCHQNSNAQVLLLTSSTFILEAIHSKAS